MKIRRKDEREIGGCMAERERERETETESTLSAALWRAVTECITPGLAPMGYINPFHHCYASPKPGGLSNHKTLDQSLGNLKSVR